MPSASSISCPRPHRAGGLAGERRPAEAVPLRRGRVPRRLRRHARAAASLRQRPPLRGDVPAAQVPRLRIYDGSVGITLRNLASPDEARSQRLHIDASVPKEAGSFLGTLEEVQLGGASTSPTCSRTAVGSTSCPAGTVGSSRSPPPTAPGAATSTRTGPGAAHRVGRGHRGGGRLRPPPPPDAARGLAQPPPGRPGGRLPALRPRGPAARLRSPPRPRLQRRPAGHVEPARSPAPRPRSLEGSA